MDMILFYFLTFAGAWVLSQAFKTVLNFFTTRKFKLKMVLSDGDFPSTHTTTSITAVITICYDLVPIIVSDSATEVEKSHSLAILAITVLWAAFIIRDALGIRLRVQELSKTVYSVLTDSKKVEESSISENLQEFWAKLASGINLKVGHMPHEVIGGLILGIIFGFGANFYRTANWLMFYISIIVLVMYMIITSFVIGRNRK